MPASFMITWQRLETSRRGYPNLGNASVRLSCSQACALSELMIDGAEPSPL